MSAVLGHDWRLRSAILRGCVFSLSLSATGVIGQAVNHFVYSMTNGLLGYPLLESIDYRSVLMKEGQRRRAGVRDILRCT